MVTGAGPEITPLAPDDPRLQGQWISSIYTTTKEDEDFPKKVEALRTGRASESIQDLAKLSLRDRATMAAFMSIARGDYARGTFSSGAHDPKIMMTLQGVPEAAQQRVTEFDKKIKTATDRDPFPRLYDEFMGKASVSDLPEELRQETTELEKRGMAITESSAQELKSVYEQWITAEKPEQQEELVKRIFDVYAQDFAPSGVKLKFSYERSDITVMEVDYDNPDVITVYMHHSLFSKKDVNSFALIAASIPHEMQHLRQNEFLRQDRGWGKSSDSSDAREQLLVIPSVQAINATARIRGEESTFGSIMQPMELQGHLLQKAIRIGIQNQLGM